jgi:hypothetical protein
VLAIFRRKAKRFSIKGAAAFGVVAIFSEVDMVSNARQVAMN